MNNSIVYPYIPNSVPEIKRSMLDFVGAQEEEQLYEEIPEELRLKKPLNLPQPILDEFSIRKHIEDILSKNINCHRNTSYLGGGCARHFTPAVCKEIMGRGEFLTSYSSDAYGDHGKYQVLFEYQSMICMLTGMEFTTFPCHDGAQAAASALSMACRITGRKKVLVPHTMNREILAAIRNYLKSVHLEKQIAIETIGFDNETGLLDLSDLKAKLDADTAAVYIENPSFLGMLESGAPEIGQLTRKYGAEFIVYADPLSLGVLEAPAIYGATIAVGDLHSLGLPLAAGGAHAGFVTVPDDMKYMLEMKDMVYGLVETSVNSEYGFSKNLFERTQFASRENAKEFTGTQSNFWAYPAAVYLSLLGPAGLEEIADTIMTNALYGAKRLSSLKGVRLRFSSPFFEEFVLDFNTTGKTSAEINRALLKHDIFGGLDLSSDFPEFGQCALFCITEVHDKKQIDMLVNAVEAALR